MPLIFLDTPQIHLLEGVRRTDPHQYALFQSDWHERGCSLVFTSTLASELRRYPDAVRRQGRYHVLADLAPVRTDLALPRDDVVRPRTFTEREIVRAMCDRCPTGAFSPSVKEKLAQWRDVLPGLLGGEGAFLLQAIEDESFLDICNLMYDASGHAANAEKLRAQNKKTTRMGDLPNAPLSVENSLDRKAAMKKAFASLREQHHYGNSRLESSKEVSAIEDLAFGFIDRMQEIGPQAALLETLLLTGLDKNALLKQPLRDHVDSWFFQFQVRKFAGEVLGLDGQGQERLAGMLYLADCAGSWLELKLRRRIGRGSADPRANHLHDAERLAYLPYVDLLLTDAEMVEFVRQIRNDKSTPVGIKEARPPRSISNSIESLAEAIHSVAP